MGRKLLPDDPHPEADDRFERLLRSMATPAVQTPQEAPQIQDEEHDEDCSDTQTPTDTSEDAS